MSGRAGDVSRLSAQNRPPSHRSTAQQLSPRRSPGASGHAIPGDGEPHSRATNARPERLIAVGRAHQHHPTHNDSHPRGTLAVSDRYPQSQYERNHQVRRSASPIRLSGPSVRPKSSSPPFRDEAVRRGNGYAWRAHDGSVDSDTLEESIKSEDPQAYDSKGDGAAQASREENDRDQQPEDMDATMSSASEPTNRLRTPHKRRTRMLMSRTQWQALSRLWDRTIFPATAEREALAREIGLTPRQVQVWFQNQRQKRRRERETDAANAALVVTSPYFTAARTAELPQSWHGEPSPRHWADAEDHSPYPTLGPRHPGLVGPHQSTLERPPPDGFHVNRDYHPRYREEHPRHGWADYDSFQWRNGYPPHGAREPVREQSVPRRDRAFDRERDFKREPVDERDEPSLHRGHYHTGPPLPEHHEYRWDPHLSRRDAPTPHSSWHPNEPRGAVEVKRMPSPSGPPIGRGPRPPFYQASETRATPVDSHHRPYRSASSPVPGRQRGPSYLPPSLTALAIDRPMERDLRDARRMGSYVGGPERDIEGATFHSPQSAHAPPLTHGMPIPPHRPPSPGAGASRPPHPHAPYPPTANRASGTRSPPKLPSLSSLLH